jgi:hypothetical protein
MSLSIVNAARTLQLKFLDHSPPNQARQRLKAAERQLKNLYRTEAKELTRSPGTLAETEAQLSALAIAAQAQTAIRQLLARQTVITPEKAHQLLELQCEKVRANIRNQKLDSHFRAGQLSLRVLSSLFLAQEPSHNGFRISPDIQPKPTTPTATPRLKIASDLLYQMHANLFPAERMLIAGGRRTEHGIELGAIFEVTGRAGAGHVRADPSKLGRALIAMDLTDTHFALWIHSHPGSGRDSTYPSSTDLEQHADWLRDYSECLVSAIMVQDRWIRFWGKALEAGRIALEISGPGILQEETNSAIIRLEQ